MTSASCATTARSSTASSARSPTRLWSRRCGTSCRRRASSRALALLLPFILAACGDDFEYQGFLNKPIPISLVQQIPVIPVLVGGRGPIITTIDTGSPVTVIHFRGDGKSAHGELRLQHGEQPSISRFIFPDVQSFDLELQPIGLNIPFTVGGVVGATLLSHFTVELRYGAEPTLTLSDEMPDKKSELAGECEASKLIDPNTASTQRCQATFNTPVVGGGLAMVGGDKVDLPSTRVVLRMCLQPGTFDPTKVRGHGAESASGVPVTAVVATGIGTSVLSRSAYNRLKGKDPALQSTPGSTLHLPYGAETVSTLTLDRVAVVSDETGELDPCGELALRRRLLIADRVPLTDADAKLIDDKHVSGASAAIAAGVQFAVVDDEAPLIQGLRKELSPQLSDIDVILGGSFLRLFDVIIDYPGRRAILRCRTPGPLEGCEVLPWCGEREDADPRCPGLSG